MICFMCKKEVDSDNECLCYCENTFTLPKEVERFTLCKSCFDFAITQKSIEKIDERNCKMILTELDREYIDTIKNGTFSDVTKFQYKFGDLL